MSPSSGLSPDMAALHSMRSCTTLPAEGASNSRLYNSEEVYNSISVLQEKGRGAGRGQAS